MLGLRLKNWQEKVVFSPDGPKPQVLEENNLFKVILAGLEPGQSIPVHPESGAVYTILQGTGWMTVDDERIPVETGSLISMGHRAARGLEAETALVFLAVRSNCEG